MQGGKDHLIFLRSDDAQRILIVASFSALARQVDWPALANPLPVTVKDVLTGIEHATAQDIALAPHQVLWLDLG